MKYIIAILSAFLVVSLTTTYSVLEKKRFLNAELNEARANYELIKTHLDFQNTEIQRAGETLKHYKDKIGELQKEYDLKLMGFQKQIKNIQTCEQGLIYLKKMLDELKVVQ